MNKTPPWSVSMCGTHYRPPLGSRSDTTSASHWTHTTYRRDLDSSRSGVYSLVWCEFLEVNRDFRLLRGALRRGKIQVERCSFLL